MSNFGVKRMADGSACLNLACGVHHDHRWNNLDFSVYARLRRHMWVGKVLWASGVLSDLRWERLRGVDPGIVCWDLRCGIPWLDETFDFVYHSHFLEHLDREVAPAVLKACYRVLRPRGWLRVVVPDLRALTEQYGRAYELCLELPSGDHLTAYQGAVEEMFAQMVRRTAFGATKQKRWVGVLERIIRGNAEDIGERHLWMYDFVSVRQLLYQAGFSEVVAREPQKSALPHWGEYRLDVNDDGSPYKRGSLYVEARKGSA